MGQRNSRTGYTSIELRNGEHFEGELKDGKRDGFGIYTWPNGVRFEGSFKNGKRNGKGILTWPNGDSYEGEYKDDKRSGYGVSTTSEYKYEGMFENNIFHGYGTLTYTLFEGCRNVTSSGCFKKGKLHGKHFVTKNSDKYWYTYVNDTLINTKLVESVY